MGVDGKGGDMEGVAEDDAGGFVPDAGEGFEFLEGGGNDSVVAFE